MAARSAVPHFTVGGRSISFPNFTVTLLRSPKLPANFARFIVPPTFNKLDLRDYLFHAYNVRTLAIRSSIRASPAYRDTDDGRRLKRKTPTKFMTAELYEPFVWPVTPTANNNVQVGFDPNGKAELPAGQEEDGPWEGFDRDALRRMTDADEDVNFMWKHDKRMEGQMERLAPAREHRRLLEEQARRLLSGEERWAPTWEVLGREDAVTGTAGKR